MHSDLISNGQDINQRGPGGQTPLMNAVLSGQTEVVKALLELGADHKIPEKDGYTPMHGAGFQGLVRKYYSRIRNESRNSYGTYHIV